MATNRVDFVGEELLASRPEDTRRASRAPTPRLVPATPPRHTHDYVYPVFTERRVDGLPIRTGQRCECGKVEEWFGRPA